MKKTDSDIGLIEHMRILISKNKINSAFNLIEKNRKVLLYDDELEDEFMILQKRCNDLERRKRVGVTLGEAEENKLSLDLLKFAQNAISPLSEENERKINENLRKISTSSEEKNKIDLMIKITFTSLGIAIVASGLFSIQWPILIFICVIVFLGWSYISSE